jgi:hypothetical protein
MAFEIRYMCYSAKIWLEGEVLGFEIKIEKDSFKNYQ